MGLKTLLTLLTVGLAALVVLALSIWQLRQQLGLVETKEPTRRIQSNASNRLGQDIQLDQIPSSKDQRTQELKTAEKGEQTSGFSSDKRGQLLQAQNEFFQVANKIDKRNWVNNSTLAPYADAYFDAMLASADDADPRALGWVAMSYIYGTEGSLMRMASPKNKISYDDVSENMREFMKHCKRAADLGDNTAIRQFALVNLSGLKTKMTSEDFISQEQLQTNLLRSHEPFRGIPEKWEYPLLFSGIPRDPETGILYLRKGHQSGDYNCSEILARAYAEGLLGEPNQKEAQKIMEEAMEELTKAAQERGEI